jgi:alkyldihydroxyacetonephosphate synthase
MISKEAIKRGYNRGNYLVGVHTPPGWAAQSQAEGCGDMQRDPVTVSDSVVDQLRSVANEVLTARHDVVSWTRDWWAGSMIAETDGNPATPLRLSSASPASNRFRRWSASPIATICR